MNTEIRVGEQLAVCDRQATIALYENTVTAAGADDCSCAYCENFAAQRTKVYPHEFLRLLNQLGADPLKELEAFDYDFGPDNSQRHLYGGWFVFCGELAEGEAWRPKHEPDSFTYWFTTSFPNSGLPKHVKLCAIEFCTEIPWVIAKLPGKRDLPKE